MSWPCMQDIMSFILEVGHPKARAKFLAVFSGLVSKAQGEEEEPPIAITFWKRPLDFLDSNSWEASAAPESSPNNVTWIGFPPKA